MRTARRPSFRTVGRVPSQRAPADLVQAPPRSFAIPRKDQPREWGWAQ
jgi:hypothetical protein